MNCKKCKAELPEGAVFCHLCGTRQETVNRKHRRGNGLGSVYKTNRGSWQCEIRGKGLERKTKGGFKTKKEAIEYLSLLFTEDQEKIDVTLKEVLESWTDTVLPTLSESKQKAYKIAARRINGIERFYIGDLTIDQLQSTIEALTYYPARDVKSLLSHLYKRACAQGYARSNLSQFMTLPKNEEKIPDAFSEDEINAFWQAYIGGQRFAGYILIMIYTGMMPGELRQCKRSMIDLEKKTITGSGLKTAVRKSAVIPIADCIAPVIEDLCGEKFLVDPMSKHQFYDLYSREIEKIEGVRKLSPYSCRHTTATALAAKVPPTILQKVMRHAKFSTTQRYVHTTDQQAAEAVNFLPTANHLPIKSQKSQ